MSQNFITAVYDTAKRIIITKNSGLLSVSDVKRHQTELVRLMDRCRNDIGHARIITDMNESAVQTKETADLITSFMSRCCQPFDRIAVIVPTSLAKMQVRRILAGHQVQSFLSMEAAEMWVTAGDTICENQPLRMAG